MSAAPYDVVVAGGGLAGTAAAAELARSGRRVVLLERSHGAHDKVCGEFLSAEALVYLRRLGIDAAEMGAVPIEGMRLAGREAIAEAALPFPAMSLSRRRLDEAMLAVAARHGAEVRRGVTVQSLERGPGGWLARVREGEPVRAAAAVLATGKHDLRGLPRRNAVRLRHDGLVAFKMYGRLRSEQAEQMGRNVELILFPGGYAGLEPVEGGRANLCPLLTGEQLRACGGGWEGVLRHMEASSPHLARRLRGWEPLLERPLAVSSIPYGFLATGSHDGLWRVGDQAAVIPSLCGDGMSIALHSGFLAAERMMAGGEAAAFQRELAAQLRHGMRLAVGLSRLLVGAPGIASLVRWAPALLPRLAHATRIPAWALQETKT